MDGGLLQGLCRSEREHPARETNIRRKDSRRIDGVVAGIMALSRAQVNTLGGNLEEFLRDPIFV